MHIAAIPWPPEIPPPQGSPRAHIGARPPPSPHHPSCSPTQPMPQAPRALPYCPVAARQTCLLLLPLATWRTTPSLCFMLERQHVKGAGEAPGTPLRETTAWPSKGSRGTWGWASRLAPGFPLVESSSDSAPDQQCTRGYWNFIAGQKPPTDVTTKHTCVGTPPATEALACTKPADIARSLLLPPPLPHPPAAAGDCSLLLSFLSWAAALRAIAPASLILYK